MNTPEKHHLSEQNNLGPDVDATAGKPPAARRKSSMRLELLDMEDDEDLLEGEGTNASRRPSTCSLSRFRSCPQLAAAACQEAVSPGMEVRDLEGDPALTVRSPTHRQRLHIDDFGTRSATPTPPSTPGSRRSHVSLKDSSRVSGLSPTSTPKLSRRAKRDLKLVRRTSSCDSNTQDRMSFSSTGVQISLRDESILRSDDLSDRFSRPSDVYPPEITVEERLSDTDQGEVHHHHHHGHHHHSHHTLGDDSNDKCQRWLQSLKITRADKIKSRSHIQLPPL